MFLSVATTNLMIFRIASRHFERRAGVNALPSSVYDFSVVQYGKERNLKDFDGQVTVVLNIASE